MKKCLLIILSVLLLVSLMVSPAFAAGATPTVSATNVEGKSGETVYVTISIKDFGPTKGMSVTKYPEGVTVDASKSEWLVAGPLFQVNATGAVWADATPQDRNGEIIKLALVVPAYTGGSNEIQLNFTTKIGDASGKLTEYPVTAKLTIKNPAESIALDTAVLAMDLSANKTATLTATVTPADTTDTVVWTSSDETVVTVENGNVTAVAEGDAVITAIVGSFSASCEVSVGCAHTNKTTVAAQPATCQATGNNLYYNCGDCGLVLDEQLKQTTKEAQTLPIVPHSGGTATCLDKPVCSMCQQPYGEKLAHVMTYHAPVAATCSTKGAIEHWTCGNAVCAGKYYTDAEGLNAVASVETPEDSTKHNMTHHAAKAATCSAAGNIEYWTCSGANCAGKIYTKADGSAVTDSYEIAIDPANHTATLSYHAKVEATCSVTGTVEHWGCSGCGKNFSDAEGKNLLSDISIAINPDNHKLTHHDPVAPTCSSKGSIEYWSCDDCAKLFDDADGKNAVAAEDLALNENPANHVKLTAHAAKAPNCSETGNIAYWTCSGTACADKKFSDAEGLNVAADVNLPIDPANHKALTGHNAVAGTCEKAGNVAYWTCSGSNCQGIYYGDNKGQTTLTDIVDPINPDNHVGSTYHAPKAATCVATGNVEYWTCTNSACAGMYFSNAECTQKLADYVTAINPDNHADGTVLKNYKAENCYQDGYSGDVHCKSCDKLLEAGKVVVATGNHVAGSAWSTDENDHWHICTTEGCGAVVGKAAHSFQWKVDQAATEDATGLKHEECACGVMRNENTVIEKLDHVHVGITHHAAVAATCTKTGTVEYWTCSSNKCTDKYFGDQNCQLQLETIVEPINASNHVGETEVKDAVEATCVKEGYSGDTYCVDCKALVKKGEKIDATGIHTPKDGYLNDEKSHWQECSVCGNVIDKAKAEHTFTWVTDKYASEYAEGEKHEECTVCKFKRNEKTVIAKLPHIPALVVGTPATCTEEGVAEHFYCYNCGQYYASVNGYASHMITKADTVLAPTGHSYGDEWMCDGEYHWKECDCGEISAKATHETELIGVVEASEVLEGYTGDTVCSVCDYVVETGETVPMIESAPATEAPTEAPTEPVEENEESSSGFGGFLAAIGGVGILALILLLLKKRKRG